MKTSIQRSMWESSISTHKIVKLAGNHRLSDLELEFDVVASDMVRIVPPPKKDYQGETHILLVRRTTE